MVLVIDNRDSFVYALVQYLGELDAKPEVYRNDAFSPKDLTRNLPSHIILSSGFGRPERAGVCIDIVRGFGGRIPILGIGVGLHAIVTAYGGRVTPTTPIKPGKTSEVCHDGRTLFAGIEYRFRATRCHALGVDLATLPACLEISATTPDGVVMGVRHREFALEGVQFQPESVQTIPGKQLLRNFLAMSIA